MNRQGLTNRFKSVGVDTSWIMATDLLTVIVSLLSFRLIANSFGTSQYGTYIGAFGAIAPLTGLAWNGVALSALQRSVQLQENPSEVAGRFFGLTAIIGFVVGTAALLLANALVPTLTLTEGALLIASELFGSAPIAISGAMLQSVDGIPSAARVRIGMMVIKAGTTLTLALTDNLTIATLGGSLALTYTLYSIWLLAVRLPRSGIRVRLLRPEMTHAKTAFQFSLPIVASSIQMDSDKTALNYYGQPEVAGLYGAAFRLVQFAAMPMNSVEAVAFHKFLSSDPDEPRQQVRRAAKSGAVTVTLGCLAGIALYITAPWLVSIAGDEFDGSVDIVRALVWWLPVYGLSTSPINGLMGLGRLGVRASVHVVSALVSIGCYIAFIPTMSWRGGLIGTIAGELTTAGLGWAALWYYQGLHDRERHALRVHLEDDPLNVESVLP